MSEFKLILQNKNIDIACVTESHFDSSLYEAEIDIPGYTFFRQDRDFKLDRSKKPETFSCGGGSVIYVKNVISVDQITNINGFDSVAILIECSIGKLLLSCFYRSPSLNLEQDMKLCN